MSGRPPRKHPAGDARPAARAVLPLVRDPCAALWACAVAADRLEMPPTPAGRHVKCASCKYKWIWKGRAHCYLRNQLLELDGAKPDGEWNASQRGVTVASSLRRRVASELKSEAEVAKEARKAKEEQENRKKKKGKGAGKDGPPTGDDDQ